MHNAAATALLTVMYLVHAAAMASGAYALGLLTGLLPPRKTAAADTGLPRALHFCLGVATGAGLLATAVAAEAALRGKFHGLIVSSLPWWSGILAAVGMGLLVRAWIAQRGSAATAPVAQPLSWLQIALVVACALAAINVTLNALAPDCQMDSLWYHLSVARAWVEWDCFDAFATVFPSNYSLLHSVLYAIALTMGDEIHCALINGLCGFICFGSAALYSRLWFGRPAAVWCWYLCATAYAAHTWFAPFHTGSDLPVAMFSTTGLLTAVHVLFGLPAGAGASGQVRQSQRLWCLSGFLLGCALAVKITTLGYMIPAWFGLCLWAVWRRPHLRWATPAALALTLLPFLPWAVRSALYGCGNPIYPLARWWLPVREGWEILLRNPSHLSVFPPTWQGLLQSMEFWPQKFQHMAYTRSPGFILHAAVVSALVLRHPLARVFGAIALAQWGAQFWTVGTNELARYFAQCFPVIFPAVAGAVAWFEDRAPVSRPIRMLALSAFAVSVAVPYI
ncbi:MAG: hypothetical protein N2111_04475, partial [Candidatus Sumerlaeaceae bacterium]|nr:hypothetical protein [Candidatus Sumerlaeaceae bacterium]